MDSRRSREQVSFTLIELGGLTLGLALLVSLGRALLELLAPNVVTTTVERWALAFLLGTGGVSLLVWWLSPIFSRVPVLWTVTGAILAIVVCALALARLRRDQPGTARDAAPNTDEWSPAARALAALLLLACGAVAFVALVTPLGWDGIFNFELKARLAFLHQPSGTIPLPYFADASRDWSHPRYPLLLPLTETWLYEWIGRPKPAALKILFPLFYFSLLSLFFAALRRHVSHTWALAGCVGLALVPAFAIGPGGATTGYADVPLAAFVFGAASYASSGFGRERAPQHIMLAAVMSALAAWTKREGVMLAMSLVAAAILTGVFQRFRTSGDVAYWKRGVLVLVLVPILVVTPWLMFQWRYGIPDTRDFLPLTTPNVTGHISRVPVVAELIGRELLRAGRWAALWPAFGVTTLLSITSFRRSSISLLTMMAAAPLVIYVGIFSLSAWPNYQEHVGTALPRLLLALAPIAWLATILGLRDVLDHRTAAVS